MTITGDSHQDYVYFTDIAGHLIGTDGLRLADPDNFTAPASIPVTTNDAGKALVYVKAGPRIAEIKKLSLEGTDWSVFATA